MAEEVVKEQTNYLVTRLLSFIQEKIFFK